MLTSHILNPAIHTLEAKLCAGITKAVLSGIGLLPEARLRQLQTDAPPAPWPLCCALWTLHTQALCPNLPTPDSSQPNHLRTSMIWCRRGFELQGGLSAGHGPDARKPHPVSPRPAPHQPPGPCAVLRGHNTHTPYSPKSPLFRHQSPHSFVKPSVKYYASVQAWPPAPR